MFGADDDDWAIYRKIVSKSFSFVFFVLFTHIILILIILLIEHCSGFIGRRRRSCSPWSRRIQTFILRSYFCRRAHIRSSDTSTQRPYTSLSACLCWRRHRRRCSHTPQYRTMARLWNLVFAIHGWCRCSRFSWSRTECACTLYRSREGQTCQCKAIMALLIHTGCWFFRDTRMWW